jgi:phosphohistidine phosphatase
MIYLLRHGHAEDGNGDDAARRLTEKGERQAEAAGRALVALGEKIDACLTSPKVRAADTARHACQALAIVDGDTLLALLRPKDLALIAA